LGEGLNYAGTFGEKRKKKKKPTEGADLYKILELINKKNLGPVIIFSFSKKDVEGYATAMMKFDFTSD